MDTSEWPHIINNYYMRPSVKRPYYYISNIEDPYSGYKFKNGKPISAEDLENDEDSINQSIDTRRGNSTTPVM